jgi:phenylalanyl-tRNA synthetase beta chain
MLISKNWLQNFFASKLPSTEELADAITFHAFEIDGIEKKEGDDILDVKITPNRGHDALSHRGIAGEVAAILNIQIKPEIDPLRRGSNADGGALQRDGAKPEQISSKKFAYPESALNAEAISITLEDPALSPRYIAAYIKGVKVGPSPDWLKGGLVAIGQRSINNIVDATNLVMFNIGQPMHAFDAGKLKAVDGKFHIVVRKARAGEKISALDNKEYSLSESMLVIADGNADAAIGIAGIKGGTPAGITEATIDIILESANFNGVMVRKTAQALKLRTDASARFEQVLSPELASFGMQNAVEIIKSIAGGELVGYADVYPSPQEERRIHVMLKDINRVLGTSLTGADVASVFTRLGFSYKEQGDAFEVVAPFARLDLTIPEDLIEEVARLIGYDKIEGQMLPAPERPVEINAEFFAAERAREDLIAQGYSEVYTSVFAEEGERAVLNKADSVKPFMRTTLVDGLNQALKKNIPNKDLLGLKEIKIFEIGAVWKDGKEMVMLGRAGEKEPAHEEPLEGIAAESYEVLPLSTASQFESFSKFPYIVRDIAMWVSKDTDPEDIRTMLYKEGGELVQKISLFDRFEKGEKTSLAFRIIFQSFDRTLTESEVNEIMQKISMILSAKGFEIR